MKVKFKDLEDNLLQATNSVRRENGLKPLTSKDLKEAAKMFDRINNNCEIED